jgi:aspartate aminotransferase
MTKLLSDRVGRIKPSATIAMSMQAARLRAQGRDIISLAAGEPDFDTPGHIRDAAMAAIDAGDTRYTSVDGTAALKDAIIEKLYRDHSLNYTRSQILVSSGAKHSIFNLLQALIDDGDEVIIPAPYWVSYPEMTALVGGQPVIVNTTEDQCFKITSDQLADTINKRSKLLILNSPSNPTGQAYSEAELQALGEVLRAHPGVLVLSDEIYEHIYWGQAPLSNLLQCCPDLSERVVLINGVSKAYAMTGWRIGYAAGPAAILGAMKMVQGQSTSNACSVSQAASVAALAGDQSCLIPMVAAYRKRHDYFIPALAALPDVSCLPGDGAFYAFACFRKAIAKRPQLADDLQLAGELLEQAGVAVVPGSAFGAPGYLRLSYATSMQQLQAAIGRLQDYLR